MQDLREELHHSHLRAADLSLLVVDELFPLLQSVSDAYLRGSIHPILMTPISLSLRQLSFADWSLSLQDWPRL